MVLKGLKINVLGDSITDGCGTSAPEKRFTDLIAARTGAVVRNYGIGGTRIARQKEPSANPLFDLCYIDRALEMDRDADVVMVFGGTNDFGHGDAAFGEFLSDDEYTFMGAMNVLIKNLITAYPSAEIVIMTPIHRSNELSTSNDFGRPVRPLPEYVEAERKYAEYYGIPVLDLWSVSGIQPAEPILMERYAPDGLHPNDLGHERLAKKIISFIEAL